MAPTDLVHLISQVLGSPERAGQYIVVLHTFPTNGLDAHVPLVIGQLVAQGGTLCWIFSIEAAGIRGSEVYSRKMPSMRLGRAWGFVRLLARAVKPDVAMLQISDKRMA